MSLSKPSLPRDLYQAKQVQLLDRIAIERFAIEGFVLMQRAGAVCFQALQDRWPDVRRLLLFAGGGNNAGDAYIVAGLAQEHGLDVELVFVSDPQSLQGDASLAWQWARERKVRMSSFAEFSETTTSAGAQTVVVDGLLGTGLDREVEGDYACAIAHINNSQLPVLAIDIPSGLSANTGMPLGLAVNADLTVTFIGLKQGLLTGLAGNHVGVLLFNDLDIPSEVYSHESAPRPTASRIDINSVSSELQPRPVAAHKGLFGHVVIVGGDFGYGGAVVMAAEAALRAGVGLVSVLTRSQHRASLLARRPEVMVLGTEDDNADIEALLAKANVIAVGPGLGKSSWSRSLLQQCLAVQISNNTTLVVDADGLNLLAERVAEDNSEALNVKRDNWILTPHPGEAARLLSCDTGAIAHDRFAALEQLQQRWGGHCLLKGHGSLILSGEDSRGVALSSEGNPGMASGGMGDILAGLIAGLVAQGLEPGAALRTGVCIHGEAADLAAEAGQRGLLATDLLPFIRQLVNAATMGHETPG